MKEYIKKQQEKINNIWFDTPIYSLSPLSNDIDIKNVVQQIHSLTNKKMFQNIEAIILADLPEFHQREINAKYEGGTLYISSLLSTNEQIVQNIIHELAHSLEEPYYNIIYGDQILETEFLNKRKILFSLLSQQQINIPVIYHYDVEFSKELDDILYNQIGYDMLNQLCIGIFVNPYSITSLKEYFADGMEEFLTGDREYLKTSCKVLYSTIENLLNKVGKLK